MHSLIKKLKNSTGSTLTINGQELYTGQYYTIQPSEAIDWMFEPDLEEKINDGDVIINDGYTDLSVEDGLKYLKFLTAARDVYFRNTNTGSTLTSNNVYDILIELENLIKGSDNDDDEAFAMIQGVL